MEQVWRFLKLTVTVLQFKSHLHDMPSRFTARILSSCLFICPNLCFYYNTLQYVKNTVYYSEVDVPFTVHVLE